MRNIKSRVREFVKNESGATLDWIVLTAGSVGMATAVYISFAYNVHSPLWDIIHDLKVFFYWFRP